MEQQELEAMNAMLGTMNLFNGAIAVLVVIAMWKMFTDAGEAGWKSLIPFYNLYTLAKITTGNGLLFLVVFIPIIGYAYLCYKTAQAWGKGIGFTVGLFFFYPIFMLILAFGGAQYRGPQGTNL